MDKTSINTEYIILFSYLKEVIVWRLEHSELEFDEAPTLNVQSLGETTLANYIRDKNFTQQELIVFLLTLAPHLNPSFLQDCIAEVFPAGADLPQFGGVKGKQHRGILPTGETALFILAGENVRARIECISIFSKDATLAKSQSVYLDDALMGEPVMSGKLMLFSEAFYIASTGQVPAPRMTAQFPAKRLKTAMDWDDLVLNDATESEIKDLEIWLQHNKTFLEDWGMKHRVKAGYRVLFHGPPGTGKTLTATILGKYTNRDVYRIDLSTVVSKYIGETEKNLSKLFDKATHKDWILFFDEADAIFGKRTNVKDAHDKYANQEVSYLLQRVETHPGLVILASNFKDNIDEAFMRRFQSVCYFPLPNRNERLKLWQKNMPAKLKLHEEISLEDVAERFELSGSNIVNIIQSCSLTTLSKGSDVLEKDVLIAGIKKEVIKEGRLF